MITKNTHHRTLKREYVEATYDILRESGIDGFTIRKVAERVGCSSAALYKHFSNADHLLALASVRYLRRYAEDIAAISKGEDDYLKVNLLLWERFAFYSFENLPIFENLFFGENNVKIQEIILEYYSIFPEELAHLGSYFTMVMQSNNLRERDFIMLKRAADQGSITLESADYLSKTDVYIFRGMLALYRYRWGEPGMAQKATDEYMELIRYNYSLHMLKK